MRRLFKWLLFLFLLLAVTIGGLSYMAHQRLDVYQKDLASLRETTRILAQDAAALEHSGDYDLFITLGHQILERLLLELRGAEHTNRLGDKVLIREAKVSFDDGFVQLEAEGVFHWRLGYKGPVRVVYQGFAQIQEDGRCRLDLRLAEGYPLGNLSLLRPVVEPWLVLQIQEKFRWPTIMLPLRVEKDFTLGEIDEMVWKDQLNLVAPGREIPVTISNPVVVIDGDGLKAIVEEIRVGGRNVDVEDRPIQIKATDNIPDVRVIMRHSVIAQALDHVIAPEKDLFLRAELLENVWKEDRKVLGMKVHNHADLHDVEGVLDIKQAKLNLTRQSQELRLVVDGKVTGRVKGRAYGIGVGLPFEADPYINELLPIDIQHVSKAMMITWPEKELTMDLPVETRLAGRRIQFNVPIRTKSNKLIRPIPIPTMMHEDVVIPEKMVRNKVIQERNMALEVAWDLHLPETDRGFLLLEGRMLSLEKVVDHQ